MRAPLLAFVLLSAPSLAAQRASGDDPRSVPPAPVLELRAAVPVGGDPEFQFGSGVNLRAGWYVRASVALLGGALRQDSVTLGVGRVEATVRFHIDPYFEALGCRGGPNAPLCKGFYGGAGLSQSFVGGGIGAEDPVLVLLLGLEGRRRSTGVWAGELALGGGLRVAAIWRRSRRDGYR